MVNLPAPAWGAVIAWYAALVLAPLSARRRLVVPALAGLLVMAAVLSVEPWWRPGDGRLRVIFLDVGQGDATLIELPEGRRLLVDGGPGGARRFDVGERVLAPFLWNRPVRRLDVVALSHSDADHAGGLAAILRHFTVGEFWENGSWGPAAEETRQALERSRAPRRVLHAGSRLWVGEALVTVLNPDGGERTNANDESLVLRLDWRGVSLLLTGDLGWEGEERIRGQAGPLRVTMLKVAHHGSRFSSSAPFLDAARPALAIVSVGARNPFRHPAPEALARLEAAGARVYRTDRDGAVIVETDGARLWVTRWARGIREVFDLDPEPHGLGI
jgi:competence protein ComEC